jgi:hypothetical protein
LKYESSGIARYPFFREQTNRFRPEPERRCFVKKGAAKYQFSMKAILLSLIVAVTIAIGWKYPVVGFVVPVVMLAGVIIGSIRGRYI